MCDLAALVEEYHDNLNLPAGCDWKALTCQLRASSEILTDIQRERLKHLQEGTYTVMRERQMKERLGDKAAWLEDLVESLSMHNGGTAWAL